MPHGKTNMLKNLTVGALLVICWIPLPSVMAQDFSIGVYYAMPALCPEENFSWDYGFMDLARHGCDFVVIAGNCWADGWAALKHWDIEGLTSYNQLNGYPGPGNWQPTDHAAGIIVNRDFYDNLTWSGEYVGDTIKGHIMADEPECHGLTQDEQDFLRSWADVYHQYNPTREANVNHCNPPWYDLHQKQVTCSVGATIAVNGDRVTARIAEAQSLGHDNFGLVAILGANSNISAWMAGNCSTINYYGFGPCTTDVINWLATRSVYQDAHEMMITAYTFGAKGYTVFEYNESAKRAVGMVDLNGLPLDDRWIAFGAAAHEIRRSQGWPEVELFNSGNPFTDRGSYPAGNFTVTATAISDSGTIAKVVFGKSTNGGADWETIEDTTSPYSATFSADAGATVIFRARAFDTIGKKSIFAADMITVQ